jgi:hypothetical protein
LHRDILPLALAIIAQAAQFNFIPSAWSEQKETSRFSALTHAFLLLGEKPPLFHLP